MNYMNEYARKLKTAEEAVELVKSGDWVDYGSNNSMPFELDAALAKRKDELQRVKVRGNLCPGPIQIIECDPEMEHFVYNTWHCGAYERKMCAQGRAFFSPMLFRNLEWYYRNFITVDVAMLRVSEMDGEGWFSLSGAAGAVSPAVMAAKRIILEVNPEMPFISGGEETRVHISRVDAIVEAKPGPLWEMPVPEPGENDRAIAANILPHIKNGSTLQLGIGGMPNALGKMLCESELKGLKMHTELMSDSYLSLFEAGKLEGGEFGLAIGTKELYSAINRSRYFRGAALRYINDPAVMAGIENLVSINSCLNVDLYGQVSSESSGTRQISGTGGQLDFVTGACVSKGGKAFLCLNSTYKDKTGKLQSCIVPKFTGGEIITTPRSQTQYVATEQGCVNLAGKTSWERAELLISIAHPDFRDELMRAAEEQRIWLPTRKR